MHQDCATGIKRNSVILFPAVSGFFGQLQCIEQQCIEHTYQHVSCHISTMTTWGSEAVRHAGTMYSYHRYHSLGTHRYFPFPAVCGPSALLAIGGCRQSWSLLTKLEKLGPGKVHIIEHHMTLTYSCVATHRMCTSAYTRVFCSGHLVSLTTHWLSRVGCHWLRAVCQCQLHDTLIGVGPSVGFLRHQSSERLWLKLSHLGSAQCKHGGLIHRAAAHSGYIVLCNQA